ncbi:MAG: hypothetical protein ACD_73C00279G0007 [uncultured bacterium]|nr:MAG: hypothetical protein ACD_73C00279G0007 [uncultured bacterium]
MFPFKNNCEKFQNEVVQFGVSKESEHLQKCQECHDFIAFYHDVRLATKDSSELEINPFIVTHIQAKAYEHVLQKQQSYKWGWLNIVASKMAPAFVAVVMFVGVGYIMGANHFNQVGDVAVVNNVSADSGSHLIYPGLQRVSLGGNQETAYNFVSPGLSFEKQMEEYRKLTMESDADGLLMRGRRLKAMGKVDQALKDFDNILEFYPSYSYLGDVLMYRAQCYAILGKFDEAVQSLEVYLEKNPTKRSLIEPMINQIQATQDDAGTLIN